MSRKRLVTLTECPLFQPGPRKDLSKDVAKLKNAVEKRRKEMEDLQKKFTSAEGKQRQMEAWQRICNKQSNVIQLRLPQSMQNKVALVT